MGLLHLDAIMIQEDGGLTVYDDDDEEVVAGHAPFRPALTWTVF